MNAIENSYSNSFESRRWRGNNSLGGYYHNNDIEASMQCDQEASFLGIQDRARHGCLHSALYSDQTFAHK